MSLKRPRETFGMGVTIFTTLALRDGQMVLHDGQALFIGVGEWTQRERDHEMIRRIVRTGLADWLRYVGEDLGPTPEDPIPAFTGAQRLERLRTGLSDPPGTVGA